MSTIKVDTYQTRGGASEIAIDKLKGVTAAGSMLVVAEGGTNTTNLQQGLAKAWITYGDTASAGNPAIYESFNISGITDNGQGDTTYAYSSNMAVAKGYTVSGTFAHSSDIANYAFQPQPKQHNSVATDTLRIVQNFADSNSAGLWADAAYVSNSMTGDLA